MTVEATALATYLATAFGDSLVNVSMADGSTLDGLKAGDTVTYTRRVRNHSEWRPPTSARVCGLTLRIRYEVQKKGRR